MAITFDSMKQWWDHKTNQLKTTTTTTTTTATSTLQDALGSGYVDQYEQLELYKKQAQTSHNKLHVYPMTTNVGTTMVTASLPWNTQTQTSSISPAQWAQMQAQYAKKTAVQPRRIIPTPDELKEAEHVMRTFSNVAPMIRVHSKPDGTLWLTELGFVTLKDVGLKAFYRQLADAPDWLRDKLRRLALLSSVPAHADITQDNHVSGLGVKLDDETCWVEV